MPTGKELRNRQLISITDGKKLGEIKDLYLNGDATRLAAVLVGKEGVLSRKALGVHQESIRVYGSDAWLVADSDKLLDVETMPESESFVLLKVLRGREIRTDGGTRIGTVGDVLLDAAAGVQGFALDKIFVEGPLAERRQIARAAIADLGDDERPMIVDLPKAEALRIAE